jgi:hypothetical protein
MRRKRPCVDCEISSMSFNLLCLLLTIPIKFIIDALYFCTNVLFIYGIQIRKNEFRVIRTAYFYVVVRVLILFMKNVLRPIARHFTKRGLSLIKSSYATEGFF